MKLLKDGIGFLLLYNILQKKYFPHKRLFKRKKRKLNK